MAPQTYRLVMRSGPTPGKNFELNKNEIYIGRDVNNDIIINDAEISRKHARVILQAGGYVLEDLGSTNGTFVNGHRLMGPHVLRPGELVLLGENVSLAFETSIDAYATLAAAPVDEYLPPAPAPIPPVELPPAPGPVEVFTPPPPPPPREPEREPYYPAARPEPGYPQARQEPVYSQPAAPPPFTGQVPLGPPEPYYSEMEPEPPTTNRNRRWIIAGCGCLLLLVCLCLLVGGYLFDSANLYCDPPFNALSPIYEALGGLGCP